jgi:hypothetical protein
VNEIPKALWDLEKLGFRERREFHPTRSKLKWG